MKVHIVSLQRTGSKSLQKAVHNALDKPLSVLHAHGSSHLGEFFHGWEFHGYKFGPDASRPFDPDDEIVFRTAEGFDAYKGRSFIPVAYGSGFVYLSYPYQEELEPRHLSYLRVMLDRFHDRNYVIKTQLGSLYEDVAAEGSRVDEWLDEVMLGHTLTINLLPSNLVDWVCSNYVCDTTGIFAPCDAQDKARTEFKASIPERYVRKMMGRLDQHTRLVDRYSIRSDMKLIHITTDSLSDPATLAVLAQHLGVAVADLVIDHPKEFSAEGYEKLIANYSDIQSIIDIYQSEHSVRPHIMSFPLTYPIA